MIARIMGLATISPRELRDLLETGPTAVFDVNSPMSWNAAHVPGAVSLDPAAFAASELPTDKNALLVFYCSNPWCRKAPNAARRAGSLGYDNVRVMSAGIKGWLSEKMPVETGAANH